MKVDRLSAKMQMFCQEYVIDYNATRAAKAAGYSDKTAGAMGHENLSKPEIKNEIARLTKDRAQRLDVTADLVIQELALIAFALKPGEFLRKTGFDIELKDKLKALESLGRATGAFNKDESLSTIIKVTIGKPRE